MVNLQNHFAVGLWSSSQNHFAVALWPSSHNHFALGLWSTSQPFTGTSSVIPCRIRVHGPPRPMAHTGFWTSSQNQPHMPSRKPISLASSSLCTCCSLQLPYGSGTTCFCFFFCFGCAICSSLAQNIVQLLLGEFSDACFVSWLHVLISNLQSA